jgi:Aspartyl/Asparaginyl beta-hydroxylase
MRNAHLISRIDVEPAALEVRQNADLWGKNPLRQSIPGSPFAGTDDIWVRYSDDPATWGTAHFPVFLPAWNALPTLHPIVWRLVGMVTPVFLGGILLTRIPAQGSVAPHCDRGCWHATFNNTKFYVILEANSKCLNVFEEEHCVMKPGEVWQFNNCVEHAVYNLGETARIALIVCMRVER